MFNSDLVRYPGKFHWMREDCSSLQVITLTIAKHFSTSRPGRSSSDQPVPTELKPSAGGGVRFKCPPSHEEARWVGFIRFLCHSHLTSLSHALLIFFATQAG